MTHNEQLCWENTEAVRDCGVWPVFSDLRLVRLAPMLSRNI